MGLFSFLSGKSPEEIEQKADTLFKNGAYGPAKLEYENALAKQAKQSIANTVYEDRLKVKLHQAREHLAREHKRNGEDLVAADCLADAAELFRLAMELTRDGSLKAELEIKLTELSDHYAETHPEEFSPVDWGQEDPGQWEDETGGSDEEYFAALCNALPEAEQQAYQNYGDFFKVGYIALNQGDFESAVLKLSQALEDNPAAGSYIPLELATAHINLGNFSDARALLDEFLKEHPESLRAYQLTCEILWDNQAYDDALSMIAACPRDLSESLPLRILKGETLFQARRFQEAVTHYTAVMADTGWDQTIAHLLARSHEALGQNDRARDLYGKIINTCQSCHSRIDPIIKQRYAETCFETGDRSDKTIELFFDLTQTDPENRARYFQRISEIYEHQGNETEARRFRAFSKKK